MYTNTYLTEQNTAMYLADRQQDAAHRRLVNAIRRQQRESEPRRGSGLTWIFGRLPRFVLRPATARSIAQA